MDDSVFIDLDAAIAERANEPIIVVLQGEKVELPGQAPGELIYQMLRFLDDEGNVKLNKVPDFWQAMVGEDFLASLFKKGISWDQLLVLQNELLAKWGISGGVAPEEGATEGPPA